VHRGFPYHRAEVRPRSGLDGVAACARRAGVCCGAVNASVAVLGFWARRAWYRSLPGVVSYREGMTVNEIINTKIDKTKLQEKYNILMSKTHHGVMDSVYTQIYKNYSRQKNVESLYQFLDSFCKNKL